MGLPVAEGVFGHREKETKVPTLRKADASVTKKKAQKQMFKTANPRTFCSSQRYQENFVGEGSTLPGGAMGPMNLFGTDRDAVRHQISHCTSTKAAAATRCDPSRILMTSGSGDDLICPQKSDDL